MWRSEEKMQPRNPKTEPSWRIPQGTRRIQSCVIGSTAKVPERDEGEPNDECYPIDRDCRNRWPDPRADGLYQGTAARNRNKCSPVTFHSQMGTRSAGSRLAAKSI